MLIQEICRAIRKFSSFRIIKYGTRAISYLGSSHTVLNRLQNNSQYQSFKQTEQITYFTPFFAKSLLYLISVCFVFLWKRTSDLIMEKVSKHNSLYRNSLNAGKGRCQWKVVFPSRQITQCQKQTASLLKTMAICKTNIMNFNLFIESLLFIQKIKEKINSKEHSAQNNEWCYYVMGQVWSLRET